MKIFFNLLLIAAAAGFGLAAGFALREKSVSTTAESPVAISAPPAVSRPKSFRDSPRRPVVRVNDDSPLATQLEFDLSMSDGVTKWLYWLEALENAVPADFPRLVLLAKGDAAATRMVAARWVELDPRHLFDTIAAASSAARGIPIDELARTLFQEWPKRDSAAAIAALNGNEPLGQRDRWRMQVVTSLIDTDAERGLRLMAEWHVENYGPRMKMIAQWAAANPRHAAEFTLENATGYVSRLAMETIGTEWGKTDPAGALEFAAAKSGELGSALGTSVVKEWAGRDLKQAADWLAGTDHRTRNRFSGALVEVWGKDDANSALAWCEGNLTGTSLAAAVGEVMAGVAQKDIVAAAALVAGMQPAQARTEAAVAVAKKWFPEFVSEKAVKPETISWLSRLDGNSFKRVLDQVQWGWVTSDPKSMAEFLATANSEHIPSSAYSILVREIARKNPSEALEWAGRLPGNRALAIGGEAYSEWRVAQPEEAANWLNGLPPSDPRRRPFFESAVRSLAYDPLAAERFVTMSDVERAAARTVIETMTIPEDRRRRLLDMLKPR